jgi:hypothetical protein
MERITIDINLSGQEEGRFRFFYLLVGALGLLYLAITLLLPELELQRYYFYWIVFLPGLIEAILYGLGKKRLFADNFPYLRINEVCLEKSRGGFFAKPDIYYWSTISAIEIKLFELQLTTIDNKVKKIDLTSLTDDNLKIVKEFVTALKRTRKL